MFDGILLRTTTLMEGPFFNAPVAVSDIPRIKASRIVTYAERRINCDLVGN